MTRFARTLSARSRLTLLYTSLFAICGAVLVTVTYFLLAHNLHDTAKTTTTTSPPDASLIARCAESQAVGGVQDPNLKAKCAALYASGIKAGAQAQRNETLDHLLTYSVVTLVVVTVLAAVLGWIVAGRILRPVHQLTAAARAASERNLSQRLALQGPRDELRDLADTFDDMLARLERAFAMQRQFIANASHELRTPLTVMRTSIDVVLDKATPTPDELTSMGSDVRDAVDDAERLIDALLTLARTDNRRPASDSLDLATLAEDALDGRSPGGLTTSTSLAPATVAGDAVLLERLIANLLDNAQRYNVPAGSIAISTGVVGDDAVLRVVNTGPVIPPEEVDRLFLPFTRLDDRTRHDGFGLGLALVGSIATMHGGVVSAASVPTGGLDITVRFPCVSRQGVDDAVRANVT